MRALLPCALATLLAAGCATEPTATERDFGNSVRHMIEQQTYNRRAATQAGTEPPATLAGAQAAAALESQRKARKAPAAEESLSSTAATP